MSIASPNPSEQGANTGEIAYRFCQECSNLLYPREDRTLNRLLYVCKSCNSAQEHDSACTYRQNLSEAAQESMGEKAFVSRDPTVRETNSSSEEDMQEFCTMCGQCLKCSTCGEGGVEDMDQDSQETADTSMSCP